MLYKIDYNHDGILEETELFDTVKSTAQTNDIDVNSQKFKNGWQMVKNMLNVDNYVLTQEYFFDKIVDLQSSMPHCPNLAENFYLLI